ncbi:MAG: ABC transporter ATP-binding protein [Christensenellaceae bacterium]|nr:ABC transporter ATP-binding protein [Christensenellaceae bacterium]
MRGISFHLDKGESLGIVGESGSGKSVASMSILRLLAQTGRIREGEVLFGGADLTKVNTRALRSIRGKRIAMVFQDPMSSLNPLIPVGDQVGEMLWAHTGLDKRARTERVLELLRTVRIPEPEQRLNSLPHEFSGGMRQRVMIALALACRPEVLIADEPTTALDVTIQDQILKLMRSLQAETGMSIIFITHDLGVVAELCTRVVVMYGGLILEEAPIDELFDRPMHPYTMGLLDSVPGAHQDKAARLTPIPGSPPDMTRPPEGCPFAPRCRYARNLCAAQRPPYFHPGEGRRSMCWLLHDDAPSAGNPFKGGRIG